MLLDSEQELNLVHLQTYQSRTCYLLGLHCIWNIEVTSLFDRQNIDFLVYQ